MHGRSRPPANARPHARRALARFAASGAVSIALLTGAVACGAPRATGAAELHWRGLLDVVGAELVPAFDANSLTRKDNPFDPYRARLFVDSRVDEHVQVLGQFVFADASGAYVDGAYAVVTPWPDRDAHVLAGKIPWAIGTWAPRTYSNKNPLVSAPLMYQYHSSLAWYVLPPSHDVLLAASGTGQGVLDYFGAPMGYGMPIVDDSYWDVGVTVTGSQRPFEYAIGVVAGAPGWGSTMRDDNSGKTVLGRIGIAPVPELRVGVSGSIGPYLHHDIEASLPPGDDVNEYDQKLVMADLEVMLGRLELRAEGANNAWEVPRLGELGVRSGYAEAKLAFPSGLYAAGRYDVERFSKISDSSGERRPWDWDVTRTEAGLGYRVTRDATAKLVWQHTTFDNGRPGPGPGAQSMVGAQLSVAF